MSNIIDLLEVEIGYRFKDRALIESALTHRSYLKKASEEKKHNERLEFLGDAVLELIVSDYLYKNFNMAEGKMTSLRSRLVNKEMLASVGYAIGLHKLMFVSDGEKKEVGHARASIVADGLEAVIGAIYLDGGYESAQRVIFSKIIIKIQEVLNNKGLKDPKTLLQELTQKNHKTTPSYKTLSSRGKDHDKIFETGVFLNNTMIAKGEGKTKQEAQTKAAIAALEIIKKDI